MAFVRTKKVKGQQYAYLVENSWQNGTAKQKVSKYLGKVEKPEKTGQNGLKEFLKLENTEEHIKNNDFPTVIRNLVMLELNNHKTGKIKLNFEDFSITNEKGKTLVLNTNEGFLCTETIKELLSYNGQEDHSGLVLAELMTRAGIKPENEVFALIFQKMKPLQGKEARPEEFYY